MITMQNLHISIDLWGAFFGLIAIVSILIGKSFDKKGSRLLISLMVCSMLLMLSDMLSWVFMGQEGAAAAVLVRVSVYCTFFFGILTVPLVTGYLTHLIVSRSRIEGLMWEYVEWAVFALGAVLLTVNLFTGFIYTIDEANNYHPEAFSILPGVIGIFGLVISIGVVLQYLKYFNKFEKGAFITYLLLPMAAIGVDMVLNRLTYTVFSLIISSLLLFFSYVFSTREHQTELEKSLADQQIRMFHQQIQPHFIFNSLAVIKYQSRKSPEEAVVTIDEFSDYLRSCSDMMNSVDCVPVRQELDLVGHYINLQKRRFGEELDYRTDVQDTDFEIPPFTIQTLVENAFTHGLRGQVIENEYISVRTYEGRRSHVVKIEDNGAGFDVKELADNSGRKHIGIKNTEERIKLMCDGSMHIESEPGKGTKVTITIPRRKTS